MGKNALNSDKTNGVTMCRICQDEIMDVRLDTLKCAAIALFRDIKAAGFKAEAEAVFDRVSQMNVPHHLYWKHVAKALKKVCRRHDEKALVWQARKVVDRAESFARIHKTKEDEQRVTNLADGSTDLLGTDSEECGVPYVDYEDLMKAIK